MSDINTIAISGRLVADPESRFTSGDKCVCNFCIAVDRPFTWGDNKKTDYFNCALWGKLGEAFTNMARKGNPVSLCGYGKIEKWEKDGEKRSRFEINVQQISWQSKGNSDSSSPPEDAPKEDNSSDEQLPF